MADHWRVLDVDEDASPEQIKAKYKVLVRIFHPDRYTDPAVKEYAELRLKEINEAYRDALSIRAAEGRAVEVAAAPQRPLPPAPWQKFAPNRLGFTLSIGLLLLFASGTFYFSVAALLAFVQRGTVARPVVLSASATPLLLPGPTIPATATLLLTVSEITATEITTTEITATEIAPTIVAVLPTQVEPSATPIATATPPATATTLPTATSVSSPTSAPSPTLPPTIKPTPIKLSATKQPLVSNSSSATVDRPNADTSMAKAQTIVQVLPQPTATATLAEATAVDSAASPTSAAKPPAAVPVVATTQLTQTINGGVLVTVANRLNANARAATSTNSPAMALLLYGTSVEAVGRTIDNSWLRVILPDGRLAWVFGELMSSEPGSLAQLPVVFTE